MDRKLLDDVRLRTEAAEALRVAARRHQRQVDHTQAEALAADTMMLNRLHSGRTELLKELVEQRRLLNQLKEEGVELKVLDEEVDALLATFEVIEGGAS